MDDSQKTDAEHATQSVVLTREPSCWSRFRRRLALICSLFIATLGVCAIIGWHLEIPSLVQIQPNFAPMQYNTALCFIGCGAGLLFSVIHLRWITLFASFTIALLSGVTLWEWFAGGDFYGVDQLFHTPFIDTLSPHPGRMSILTAACFFVSSISLLASVIQKSLKKVSWFTGSLSSLILSTSILGLIGYSTGLTNSSSWNIIAQMSLPTVFGFFALSLGSFSIAWTDNQVSEKEAPGWLPMAIPIIALTATGLLGAAIHNQEQRDIIKNIQSNAKILETALNSELNSRHQSIRRMAKRLSHTDAPVVEHWRADALEYTLDDKGYYFIGITDENMRIQDIVPTKGRLQMIGFQAVPKEMDLPALRKEWEENNDVITKSFDLYPDGLTLLTPIFKNGQVSGSIIAPINLKAFFSALYPDDLSKGYHFNIYANGKNVHTRSPGTIPSEAKWIKTQSFQKRGTDWIIRVWPSDQLINTEHAFYSNLVVGLGVLSAILIGIAIYFSQLAQRKSSESSSRNIRLQEEIMERIKTSKKLEQISALNDNIILHSAYSVISTTADGIITSFNPAAEKMLGYSADEIVNKLTLATFHDPNEVVKRSQELSDKYGEPIEPGFATFIKEVNNGRADQREWTYIRKDGSRLPVTLGITKLTSKNDETLGYLGIAGDITELKKAEAELKKTHDKLVQMSMQVGRAEVATNILHNVGNVLNSVNISASLLAKKVKESRTATVTRISDLLNEHKNNLADFIQTDRRGQELPEFITKLSKKLADEKKELLEEISKLDGNIGHIKEIVAMQQGHAKSSNTKVTTNAKELIDTAIQVNSASLQRDHFKINIECKSNLEVFLEKHKAIQILVNLISNAKHACQHAKVKNPTITASAEIDDKHVIITVEDNGEGIIPENITRIFAHGFTTKKDGHGFGLHGSALAAKEMGGALKAYSDGKNKGAKFTLSIPTETSQPLAI